MDIIDPLRHLEISGDLTKCSSSSEESLPELTSISSAQIPEYLPVDICNFLFQFTSLLMIGVKKDRKSNILTMPCLI